MDQHTFLREPSGPETEAAYAEDRDADGYVSNMTRVWAWRLDFLDGFAELRTSLTEGSALTERDRAVLNAAAASARADAYCSLAWGPRLAALTDDETAAQVLRGEAGPALSQRESELAAWAREVVRAPGETTQADVARLRDAGLTEREIFEATAYVALRLAFSTINGALGAAPDGELAAAAPEPIRAAVTYGRPPSG
jgi:alkylhydroperoxidase family enzyme